MRQRIQNDLLITVNGVDLNDVSDLEFYLKQGYLFFEYTPIVYSSNEILVRIPLKDALKLKNTAVDLQLAFKNSNGNPMASDVVSCPVKQLLKEVGYGLS